jgi:HlyD family secretion protein
MNTPASPPSPTPSAAPDHPLPPDDLAQLLDEPAPRAWYRRRMVWAGALLLVLLVGGIGYWQAKKSANAAPAYQTQPVTRGNLSMTVTANGTLQPVRTTSIGSELSGTVLKVNVDVNDVIKKGQVLVELDTAKLAACRT